MLLDCKTMTGVIYNCPNLSECLRNYRLNKIQVLLLYLLNQGFKPEDIKVDGEPLQVSQFMNHLSDLDRAIFVYNRDYQTGDSIIFNTCLN